MRKRAAGFLSSALIALAIAIASADAQQAGAARASTQYAGKTSQVVLALLVFSHQIRDLDISIVETCNDGTTYADYGELTGPFTVGTGGDFTAATGDSYVGMTVHGHVAGNLVTGTIDATGQVARGPTCTASGTPFSARPTHFPTYVGTTSQVRPGTRTHLPVSFVTWDRRFPDPYPPGTLLNVDKMLISVHAECGGKKFAGRLRLGGDDAAAFAPGRFQSGFFWGPHQNWSGHISARIHGRTIKGKVRLSSVGNPCTPAVVKFTAHRR